MVIVWDREITIDLTVRLDRCLTIMFEYITPCILLVKTRVTTDHITLEHQAVLLHTYTPTISDRPPVAVDMSLTFLVRYSSDCLCVCVCACDIYPFVLLSNKAGRPPWHHDLQRDTEVFIIPCQQHRPHERMNTCCADIINGRTCLNYQRTSRTLIAPTQAGWKRRLCFRCSPASRTLAACLLKTLFTLSFFSPLFSFSRPFWKPRLARPLTWDCQSISAVGRLVGRLHEYIVHKHGGLLAERWEPTAWYFAVSAKYFF